MCGDVLAGAAQTRNSKTNPPTPTPRRATIANDANPNPSAHANTHTNANSNGHGNGADGDDHNLDLTSRQVAAARLLALGRCGRSVAAEVGVNEHTITRWRRTRRFDVEVRRQHALVLAEQVRQRRAEAVDAYAVVAERIVRKYGMMR